jgi:protein involved in polysaccharide export with SLBB domain
MRLARGKAAHTGSMRAVMMAAALVAAIPAGAQPPLHTQHPALAHQEQQERDREARMASSQRPAPPPPARGEREDEHGPHRVMPFGANMFTGAYAGQREDALNPEYRIMPGDRVMVNAWGAVPINDVFTVDTQGNIFLPNIGPVRLSGVRNEDLTETVRGAIARVYRGNFGVYTNLLTSSPVAVFVTGGVQRPGRYAGIPSDSALFFIDQAGGIHHEVGSYRNVSILRMGQPVAEFDLYDFLLRGQLPVHQFADGDTILVGRRGPVVEVHGAVPEPRLVEMTQAQFTGAQVLDVVPSGARANGVTVRGLREGARAVSSLSIPAFRGMWLRDGDVVEFREEGLAGRILVRLEGEYVGPAVLSVRRGTRLLDLLNYVRVDPQLSDVASVHLRREQVIEQQRMSIEQSLDRLERSAMLALSGTRGESDIRVREAELVRDFVSRARNIQPLGRVVTKTAGYQLNVILQDNDTIVIPQRTNVVRVSGEVQVSQAVMYRPDLKVRDYVKMAGGYTNRAETSAAIVIRPSAEVLVGGSDLPVRPGDEVMIPPEIDKKIFQNTLDLSTVIYQIAIASSVLIGLL